MADIQIRTVRQDDQDFWFSLDKHLPLAEFPKKVRDKQGYVLSVDGLPVGILRYHLFWDNTPFCTLLYLHADYRRKGYGKKLMAHWEREMRLLGYDWLLVSTQADETAQYFYRAIGYSDCGSLSVPHQPEELFLGKHV